MSSQESNSSIKQYFESASNYEPSPKATNAPPKSGLKLRLTGTKRARSSPPKPKKPTLPKGAKYGAKTLKVTKTSTRQAERFFNELQTIPIYLISGHSCICSKAPTCYGQRFRPEFSVPKDTYLITFIAPGEFFCLKDGEQILFEHKDQIRNFLVVHSESDVEHNSKVGKTKMSLFTGIRRAVGSNTEKDPVLYPNIAYTFNTFSDDTKKEVVPRDENIYGVYRIDNLDDRIDTKKHFVNTNSVLPQDAKRKGDTWFLSDIISEVYEKEKIKRAIFIQSGCFSSCSKKSPLSGMDEAARTLDVAHNRYTSLRETLTKTELTALKGAGAVPYDMGVFWPTGTMALSEIKHMEELGVTDPSVYVKDLRRLLHKEEYKAVVKLMEAGPSPASK